MDQKTRVEVQIDGAWTEAVIVDAYGRGRGRHYKVRDDPHPDSDAQRLTQEEDVCYTRVRPIPPEAPHNYNYSIRDAVEASDKGCWWPKQTISYMKENIPCLQIVRQLRRHHLPGICKLTHNLKRSLKEGPRREITWNKIRKKIHFLLTRGLYVYDDRKDGNDRGIKATPGNDVKRFKVTESTESMDQILKYTETPVERCTGSAILGSPRTELDNKAQRNNPLNMVAEERLETHDERCTGSAILGSPRTELDNKAQRNNPLNMVAEERLETHDEELLAYHSVLEAFYAQSQCHFSWERHDFSTRLRIALHITTDEHADKLKRLISQS
eukprot:PITA_20602